MARHVFCEIGVTPQWTWRKSPSQSSQPCFWVSRRGETDLEKVSPHTSDQALRALKKKLQREGVFREMRLKEHFEKPSVRKAREKKEAVSRQRKLARKKAEREGML